MKDSLDIILKFVKPHKYKFVLLFICVVITTFSGSLYPYIFGKLVDEVFYVKSFTMFYKIILIYGVVFVFNQLMHFVLNMTWANLMTKFLFDIRKAIYSKVLSYEGKTLSSLHSGDIVYRMGADTEQFMNFIHGNVFYLFSRILSLVISIGFMAYIYWPLACFAILFTPIIVYVSSIFSKKIKAIYKKHSDKKGLLSSWLFEIIKGMQEVRVLNATKRVNYDYIKENVSITRLQVDANKLEVTSEQINKGISLAWRLALYCLASIYIFKGYMTVGGFTACVSYFESCIYSFGALNYHITGMAGNMASVDRVCSVLNKKSERNDGNTIPITNGDIKFDQVHFSYNDDGNEVLKGVSFSVSGGEKIALVGRSGEGKSTIASMLLGFNQANSGRILIDNTSISEYSLSNLREQIGVVQQDTILFDGSIRYNLIFSEYNARDNEIWGALRKAGLYEFIEALPEKLDTVIGINNRSLSGGQKQRLTIARIILKNPKILVFDEATSSLDSEAEQIIRNAWDELCKNRTIIIIAHRLSTILGVDRMIVLEHGNIVGNDTHERLMESCDTYINLFKEQYYKQAEEVTMYAES